MDDMEAKFYALGIKTNGVAEGEVGFLNIIAEVKAAMNIKRPFWVAFGSNNTFLSGYPGSRILNISDDDFELPDNFKRCLVAHELMHLKLNYIREWLVSLCFDSRRVDMFLRKIVERFCDKAEVKYGGRENAIAFNIFLIDRQKENEGISDDVAFFCKDEEEARSPDAKHPSWLERLRIISGKPVTSQNFRLR